MVNRELAGMAENFSGFERALDNRNEKGGYKDLCGMGGVVPSCARVGGRGSPSRTVERGWVGLVSPPHISDRG